MIVSFLAAIWARLLLLALNGFAHLAEIAIKIAVAHKTEVVGVFAAAGALLAAGSNFERGTIAVLSAISYLLGRKHA